MFVDGTTAVVSDAVLEGEVDEPGERGRGRVGVEEVVRPVAVLVHDGVRVRHSLHGSVPALLQDGIFVGMGAGCFGALTPPTRISPSRLSSCASACSYGAPSPSIRAGPDILASMADASSLESMVEREGAHLMGIESSAKRGITWTIFS